MQLVSYTIVILYQLRLQLYFADVNLHLIYSWHLHCQRK